MKYRYYINYKQNGPIPLKGTRVVEVDSLTDAKLAAKRELKSDEVLTSIRYAESIVTTWDEFIKWAEENGITPERAQSDVEIMDINGKNNPKWMCPQCGYDISGNGPDKKGQVYRCPRCRLVLQEG